MRVDAKISARQWILNAIQNHSCIPNKATEREIRNFVTRLQRDLSQLTRSRDLYLAVNSQDSELAERALNHLSQEPKPKDKGQRRRRRQQEAELRRLIKDQRKDASDRNLRFEHAISK